MTKEVNEAAWPASRLEEAIEALARRSGFASRAGAGRSSLPDSAVPWEEPWIEAVAARFGLEVEQVEVPYADLSGFVHRAGPAILQLPEGESGRFLALAGAKRGSAVFQAPNLTLRSIRPDAVCATLRGSLDDAGARDVDQLLAKVNVRGRRRARARAALLAESLAGRRIRGLWILRPTGAAGVAKHAHEAHLLRRLSAFFGAHSAQLVFWILSWWVLGRMALEGRWDPGWFLAWAVLCATFIACSLLASRAAGVVSILGGGLFKRVLLSGALKLEPDELRLLGAGQLLGRVIESEVVEETALTGGFLGLMAAIQLSLAGFVLSHGAGGPLHIILLAAWSAIAGATGLWYYRRRRAWTDARIGMTDNLVERMVGHRTRIAQEPRERWNEGEDRTLSNYFRLSSQLDQVLPRFNVLIPRGWFLVGLVGLAPAVLRGSQTPASLAIAIGGVLLALQAFEILVGGIEALAAAAIAWGRAGPLWKAAGRSEADEHPKVQFPPTEAVPSTSDHRTVLEGLNLSFRYGTRSEPVFLNLNLRIREGDRLLVEGPSGAGKSTLAAILSACRPPDSGLLFFRGLDAKTIGGKTWRRRVVLVPQFHENHLVTGTLAFNLLLGRGWPPQESDLQDAERVCRDLGLGGVLGRMPAGLLQMVGETGWQLSHGERTRVYLARALLQDADVLVLDESFAALDPETLKMTAACVLAKSRTLVLITHR